MDFNQNKIQITYTCHRGKPILFGSVYTIAMCFTVCKKRTLDEKMQNWQQEIKWFKNIKHTKFHVPNT